MGSFIHYCEHCNAKLNVDNAWLGKSMKCPACGKKITFPEADTPTVQSVPTVTLGNLPDWSGKNENDFPAPPDLGGKSDMPSAPDFSLPDPPATSPAPATGGAPRRIKLKPLKGKSEAVPGNSDTSLPPTRTEVPLPPPLPTTGSQTRLDDAFDQPNAVVNEKLPEAPTAEVEPKKSVAKTVVEPEAFSDKHSVPVIKGFFKGSYFWGRLGCSSVYVLVAVAIIMGVYFSWNIYCDYRLQEELIPEKHALSTVNKELYSCEKKLSSQFKNAVNLLQGSGNIENGVLDGLKLPDDVCRNPDPMPLSLLSSGELKKAQSVLEQYKQSSKKLKEEFIKCFGKIMLFENSGDSSKKAAVLSQIVLQVGEVKKQFYANEQVKLAQLSALENAVANTKRRFAASGNANADAFKNFDAASRFVRNQLFPQDSNITVVKGNRQSSAASGNQGDDIARAVKLIAALSDGWQLDLEIASMDMLLEKVPVLTGIYEKKKNAYLRVMGKELVKLWVGIVLVAFVMLVVGDVLRAFFDNADTLRRMEGKK